MVDPNPNYYGGPVCPTLRFISIPGSQSAPEAVQNDEVQVGYLSGAEFISPAWDQEEYNWLTSRSRASSRRWPPRCCSATPISSGEPILHSFQTRARLEIRVEGIAVASLE